jgi:Zn-dependent peptidase ImmA (M78 family)
MAQNKLSLQRQSEIVDVINNLKLSLNMTYPEVDLKKIINGAIPGVQLKEDDFNGNAHVKGAVFRKSKKYTQPVIAIQSNQSPRSKTFALAHEFAHYILDHNPAVNYFIDDRAFDGSKVMQQESEASFFAQTLLMPKSLFESLDQPFVGDKKLADYFGVSESTVGVRREWLKRNGY